MSQPLPPTGRSREAAAFELGRVIEELHEELRSQPMEPDDLPDDDEVLDKDGLPDDDDSIYYSIPSTPTD